MKGRKILKKKDLSIKDLAEKIDSLVVATALNTKNMATLLNDSKYHSQKISSLEDKFVLMETEIKDLIEVVSNSFEKIENKIDITEKSLSSKIDGLDRRLDDLALNRVKYEDFMPLKTRVEKLEHRIKI